MHARTQRSIGIPRQDGQDWRCLTGSLAAVIALGFTLASLAPVQARTFQCGAGDVDCLIAAINEANANGQTNTIRLAAGTYTLSAIDNGTGNNTNGLPVISSPLTIEGAGTSATIIERDIRAPAFRLLRVVMTGILHLNRLTLRGGGLSGGT